MPSSHTPSLTLHEIPLRPHSLPAEDPFRAPVKHEITRHNLPISGQIPEELRGGAYIRNGPNPPPEFEVSTSWHSFDGDGMLHCTKINEDGSVSYSNRYVNTSLRQQDLRAGRHAKGSIADAHGARGIGIAMLEITKKRLGVFSEDKGFGTANTSVVVFGGKILACHEGDYPYLIELDELGVPVTKGRLDMTAMDWPFPSVTAHPKVLNGQLHVFGYKFDSGIAPPFLHFGVYSPDFQLVKSFPISTPQPSMMHDFAVTSRHVIFMDLPLVIDVDMAVKEDKIPVGFKPEISMRFGVLPLDSDNDSAIRWFSLSPSKMSFHVVNSYETPEGLIKVVLCCSKDFDMALQKLTPETSSQMAEVTIDLNQESNDVASFRYLLPEGWYLDFPVIHPSRVGQQCQWAFASIFNSDIWIPGIAKVDLTSQEQNEVHRIDFGTGRSGGEVSFVPRKNSTSDDDGWLCVYVYDKTKDQSTFEVYDAQTFSSTPVAVVPLPQRVPFGFHGAFVPPDLLQNDSMVQAEIDGLRADVDDVKPDETDES